MVYENSTGNERNVTILLLARVQEGKFCKILELINRFLIPSKSKLTIKHQKQFLPINLQKPVLHINLQKPVLLISLQKPVLHIYL